MSKTIEELKKIAMDIVDDKIFTSGMARNELDLIMIFMPIGFGAFKDMTSEERANIGIIYEYYSEAGPRGINGYPIFASLRFLNREDSKTVAVLAEKYIALKQSFEDEKETDSKNNT